jgi:hypothetical protein
MPRIDNVEEIKTTRILTDDGLLKILQDFIDVCEQKGENPTKERFVKYTRLNFGYSKVNAIIRRFASKPNKNDGWRYALIKCGRTPMKRWTLQEILDKYYEKYVKLGNKQPTVHNMKEEGLAPHSIMYKMRRLYPNLEIGGHFKVLELMYKQHGIKAEIQIPEYHKRAKRKGDDLRKFKINVDDFGLEIGPVNEQGVVALFSKIHSFIGFPRINYITQAFPDCEAESTLRDGNNIDFVKIEFKYETANPHETKKEKENWGDIDYLVCWLDNGKSFREKLERKRVRIISLRDKLSDEKLVKRINSSYSLFSKGVEERRS